MNTRTIYETPSVTAIEMEGTVCNALSSGYNEAGPDLGNDDDVMLNFLDI